jgi:hypothetical protein
VLVVVWAATRELGVAISLLPAHGYVYGVMGDTILYRYWAHLLAAGQFPVGDPTWQYPPGAAGVIVLPELAGQHNYHLVFCLLMVAVDAGVLALLLRRFTSPMPAWIWTVVLIALGPIVWNRFDLVPTAAAVAALAFAAARPRLAGALIAFGALVKIWPVVVLGGVRRVGAVAVAGVVTILITVLGLAAAGLFGPSMDFAKHESVRGLQIESVAATPFMVASAFGSHAYRVVHQHGAYEITGPGVGLAGAATTLAELVALAVFAWVAVRDGRRGTPRPAAVLAVVIALMLCARVLSPQYLIWPIGVAAFCVGERWAAWRRVMYLLAASSLLTGIYYPWLYSKVIHARLLGVGLVAGRNVLLVAVLVATLALMRSGNDMAEHGDVGHQAEAEREET